MFVTGTTDDGAVTEFGIEKDSMKRFYCDPAEHYKNYMNNMKKRPEWAENFDPEEPEHLMFMGLMPDEFNMDVSSYPKPSKTHGGCQDSWWWYGPQEIYEDPDAYGWGTVWAPDTDGDGKRKAWTEDDLDDGTYGEIVIQEVSIGAGGGGGETGPAG